MRCFWQWLRGRFGVRYFDTKARCSDDMRRVIIFLVVLAALPVVALLLASLGSSYLPLADSFAHFRAHYLVLLLLALLVSAILKATKLAAIVTAAIAIGLWSTYPAWPGLSPLGSEPQDENPRQFKLVQFNTLFKNPTVDRSAQWILAQSPDFVMMQEVSSKTLAIYDQLGHDLPFGVVCKFATVGGVAVRSKHPIATQFCKEKEGFVWAQVNVDGKAITLSSLHLHWPYPYGQWQQLQTLEADFRAMPRPVVLTGDFNAAPWSAAVSRVANATDTSVVPGFRLTLRMGAAGLGPVTFLPIDQVLLPPSANVTEISAGPPIGSDHLPVIAEFTLE